MAQSLANIVIHLIFSTKNRLGLVTPDIRPDLYAYMAVLLDKRDFPAITIGGERDHVHILCHLSRACSIADLLKDVKTSSSKWLKPKGRALSKFSWQAGYGAFSVSEGHVRALRSYIDTQESHHRRESFQDEFRRILRKNHVELDERYVWD